MSTRLNKPRKSRNERTVLPGKDDGGQVGYKRPPRHSQFKPGQSGNPRGRPEGARNIATEVKAVLGRRLTVIENGQRKLVSAMAAILRRYLEAALKGDVKAGAFLLSLHERLQPMEGEAAPEFLSEKDHEIVANLFRELQDSPER